MIVLGKIHLGTQGKCDHCDEDIDITIEPTGLGGQFFLSRGNCPHTDQRVIINIDDFMSLFNKNVFFAEE